MDALQGDEHVDPVAWLALQRRIYRTSLKVWWSREFGYLSVLDPFTGEVIDIPNESAERWMKRRAFEEKARRQAPSNSGRSAGSR